MEEFFFFVMSAWETEICRRSCGTSKLSLSSIP